jgi:hypothetical protein
VKTLSDFIGTVKTRKAEIATSLAEGHASNFEAYQRMVGQYQGLDEKPRYSQQLDEGRK